MEITLQDYQEVVGPGVIEELRNKLVAPPATKPAE